MILCYDSIPLLGVGATSIARVAMLDDEQQIFKKFKKVGPSLFGGRGIVKMNMIFLLATIRGSRVWIS